jgi:hypothetical protein
MNKYVSLPHNKKLDLLRAHSILISASQSKSKP